MWLLFVLYLTGHEISHNDLKAITTLFAYDTTLFVDYLLILYNSLVYPILMQDVIIWGGSSSGYLNKINILQNKILRFILKVKIINFVPDMHVNDMYKKLSLLKFNAEGAETLNKSMQAVGTSPKPATNLQLQGKTALGA